MKGNLGKTGIFKVLIFLVAIIVKVCMGIYVFINHALLFCLKCLFFYVDVIMAGNELYTWIFQQFTFKKKKKDNSILKFIDSFLLTFSTDHLELRRGCPF